MLSYMSSSSSLGVVGRVFFFSLDSSFSAGLPCRQMVVENGPYLCQKRLIFALFQIQCTKYGFLTGYRTKASIVS